LAGKGGLKKKSGRDLSLLRRRQKKKAQVKNEESGARIFSPGKSQGVPKLTSTGPSTREAAQKQTVLQQNTKVSGLGRERW